MRSNFLFLLLAIVLTRAFTGLASAQQVKQHGPIVLEGVEPEMLTPEYWIALQPDPDRVIMTPLEIQEFNRKAKTRRPVFEDFYGQRSPLEPGFVTAEMLGTHFNPVCVFELTETLPGDSLRVQLNSIIDWLYPQNFYDDRRAPLTAEYKEEVITNMNMRGIGDIVRRRYGVVVNQSNVRIFPTPRPAWHNPTSTNDYFQRYSILVGEPVSIIHQSVDGEYLYIESRIAKGWVLARDIAYASRKEAQRMGESKRFAVITEHRIPVYSDPEFSRFANHLYLSTKLPLNSRTESVLVVELPYRRPDGRLGTVDGYIRPDAGIHEGWMPYTKRNVLNVMFGLMELPYGWGDRDGYRSCSGTVIAVMKCFGIITGRRSAFVLMAADNIRYIDPGLSMAEKIQAVSDIEPVITIAGDWGHVVVYLGRAANGKYYFIHQGGFGYRDSEGNQFIMGRQSVNHLEHPWYDINKAKVFTTFR